MLQTIRGPTGSRPFDKDLLEWEWSIGYMAAAQKRVHGILANGTNDQNMSNTCVTPAL